MLPKKYAPILFALLLSGGMSCMVCFVATVKSIGMPAEFVRLWLSAWLTSWCVAFPAAYFFAPVVRRIVDRLTREDITDARDLTGGRENPTGNRV